MTIKFNRGGNTIDARNVDEHLSQLLELVKKLSGTSAEVSALRDNITSDDATPQEIIDRLNEMGEDFANKLKDELKKVSDDFDEDDRNEKLMDFVKQIAEDRKSSKNNEPEVLFKKYIADLPKQKSDGGGKSNNVENTENITLSFDQITNPTLKAKIEENFSIDGGKLENNGGTAGIAANFDMSFVEDLQAELVALKLMQEKANKEYATAVKTQDKDKIKAAEELIASIQGSTKAIEEVVQETNETVGKNLEAFDKKAAKTLDGMVNNIKANNEKAADDAMNKSKKSFDILSQGSSKFGEKLNTVSDAAGHLSSAFEKMGQDGMKSFGEAQGYFNDFARMLTSVGAPIAALGAAMAMVGKAVGAFHDQLDISRSMGDTNGNLVKDLQRMHIRTLMDPGQLKALSEDLSMNFGMSLTKNQKDVEKMAVKQRLTERVMGKEYAESQMEALGSLKDVLEGSSASAMMDSLQAETSALAKTMGISNKMALQQLKAMDQNTKVLTEGLNRDMAKDIQKTFKKTEAGLVAAGMSVEDAAEVTKVASETLASKDALAAEQSKMMMMIESGGAGGEELKATFAKLGMDQQSAMALMAKTQTVGFNNLTKEEKAKMQEIMVSTQVAQAKDQEKLAKILNDDSKKGTAEYKKALQQKMLQDSAGYKSNSNLANAMLKNGEKGFDEARAKGEAQYEARSAGEATTPEFNKLLVAMGATDKDSKKSVIDKLVNNLEGADKAKFDELKALGLDDEEALKSALADSIKEQGANLEKGMSASLAGININESRAKEIQSMDPTLLTEKMGNLTATGVEITKDKVEQASTEALYKFQNVIMDLVNNVLPALIKAVTFVTENFKTLAIGIGAAYAAFKAYQLIKKVKIPKLDPTTEARVKINKSGIMLSRALDMVTKRVAGKSRMNFGGPKSTKGMDKASRMDIINKRRAATGKTPLSLKSSSKVSLVEKVKSVGTKIKSVGTKAKGIGPKTVSMLKNVPSLLKTAALGVGSFAGKAASGMASMVSGAAKFAGPIGLAVTAVMAAKGAVEGWNKASEYFNTQAVTNKDRLQELGYSLDEVEWDEAAGAYRDMNGNIIRETATFSQKMSSAMGGALSTLSLGMLDAQETAQWIQENLGGIWDSMKRKFDAFLTLMQPFVESLKNIWESIKTIFIEPFKAVFKLFTGDISGAFESLKKVWGAIGDLIMEIPAMIWNGLSGLGGMFMEVVDSLWWGIKKGWWSLMDWWDAFDIGEFFMGIITGIGNGIKAVFSWFGKAFSKAFEFIGNLFSGLVSFFGDSAKGSIEAQKILDENNRTDTTSKENAMVDKMTKMGLIGAQTGQMTDRKVDLAALKEAFKSGKIGKEELVALTKDINGGDVDYKDKMAIAELIASGGKSMGEADTEMQMEFNVDEIKKSFAPGQKIEVNKDNEAKFKSMSKEELKKFYEDNRKNLSTDAKKKLDDMISVAKSQREMDADAKAAQMKKEREEKLKTTDEAVKKELETKKSVEVSGTAASIDTPTTATDTLSDIPAVTDTKDSMMSLEDIGMKTNAILEAILAAVSGPSTVSVKSVPAHADGGSTGGLGDQFAKMIMVDDSKEEPVGTVGTDEFVFSKDMIQNAMARMKEMGGASGGATTVSSVGGIDKAGEMKAKDAQKENLKEQKKMQDEQVKKQAKEGIDDKQATTMAESLSKLKDWITTNGGAAGAGAVAAAGAVGTMSSKVGKGVKDVGGSLLSNISDVFTGKKSPTEAFASVGNTLMDVLPSSSKTIVGNIGEIGGKITENFKGMLNGETTLGEGIKNMGDSVNEKAITPLKDTFTSFGSKFSSMFGGIVDKITSSPVFKKGKEIIGNVVDAGKGFMEKIAGFIHKSETGKSAGDYGAAKDIGDGAGISFGAYQLTEKSGGINEFLKKMAESGDAKAAELQAQFNKGGNSFKGNKAELTAYLKEAGKSDAGKAAQDEIYSKKYVEPAMKLAAEKGITDKAAIAQIVDHSVNAGLGGAKRMLKRAKGTSADDIANARKDHYQAIANADPSKQKYLKGWNNRVNNNSAAFKEYAGVDIGTPDKTRVNIPKSPNANQKPVVLATNDIKAKKQLSEIQTPKSNIPVDTSAKIASNNIVAKNTASQINNSTVNNTTTNNDPTSKIMEKTVTQLVAINEKQLHHQTKSAQEATKLSNEAKKANKHAVDRADNNRQHSISNNRKTIIT